MVSVRPETTSNYEGFAMKTKVITFIALLIAFAAGWLVHEIFREPRARIVKEPLQYNTVYRNYAALSHDDCTAIVKCFSESVPELDIDTEGGDSYLLTAGLCDRKWSRKVKIRSPAYRNIIYIAATYRYQESEFITGITASYIRKYSRIGFGGGMTIDQRSAGIHAGLSVFF
jgi:hypothetical protein